MFMCVDCKAADVSGILQNILSFIGVTHWADGARLDILLHCSWQLTQAAAVSVSAALQHCSCSGAGGCLFRIDYEGSRAELGGDKRWSVPMSDDQRSSGPGNRYNHRRSSCAHLSGVHLWVQNLLIGQLNLDNTFLLMFCLIHRRIASACPPVLAAHRNTTPAFLDHHSSWIHHGYTAAYRLHCQVPMSVSGCWLLVPATVHCCCELSENNNI